MLGAASGEADAPPLSLCWLSKRQLVPTAALALRVQSRGSAAWLCFCWALHLLHLHFREDCVPVDVTARAALVAEVPPG